LWKIRNKTKTGESSRAASQNSERHGKTKGRKQAKTDGTDKASMGKELMHRGARRGGTNGKITGLWEGG